MKEQTEHAPWPWRPRNIPCTITGDPVWVLQDANWRTISGEHDIILASAAPDLLAALQMFIAQYEGNGNDDRETRPEMKAARAALARATGKGEV